MATLDTHAPVALRRVEQQEAVVGDVADEVADLIHVGLHEHARAFASDSGDDVADGVAPDLLARLRPAFEEQLGELALGARWGRDCAELLEDGLDWHDREP
jgi:hypothetical protein